MYWNENSNINNLSRREEKMISQTQCIEVKKKMKWCNNHHVNLKRTFWSNRRNVMKLGCRKRINTWSWNYPEEIIQAEEKSMKRNVAIQWNRRDENEGCWKRRKLAYGAESISNSAQREGVKAVVEGVSGDSAKWKRQHLGVSCQLSRHGESLA